MCVIGCMLSASKTDNCPDGWVKFDETGLCYLPVYHKENLDDHLERCVTEGAFLANPKTANERTFVSGLFQPNTVIRLDGTNEITDGIGMLQI